MHILVHVKCDRNYIYVYIYFIYMTFQSLYKVSMINRCSLGCIHDFFGYEIEKNSPFGNKDAITDKSHTNRQVCVSNKDSRQLNCPCFSVSCCKSVSLSYYLTLPSVTSLLCLKFLPLFFAAEHFEFPR